MRKPLPFPILFATMLLMFSWSCRQPSSAQITPSLQEGLQAFIVDQMTTRHVYKSDGSSTSTDEVRVRVLSAAGVQALGQLRFGYNSDSQQLSIDYVRVRKAGGDVVSTPLEKAPEVSLVISKDAPVYTDYRERHISVAALAPGDTLEYKVTKLSQPLAANQFWLSFSFDQHNEVRDQRLIVEVPKGRELKIKSRRPYSTEESSGATIYSWKSSHAIKAPATPEPGKDASEEDAANPDVQLSTFQSWRDVSRWYEGLLSDRVAASPEVKAKADEITKGATNPEEKERRLYDFVSKNIRYVSLSFGVGRYQPHTASEVLHNEYGDCKDKHTLLAALLKGAGINSHAVLIHSVNELDRDVPAPSQFNHVITSIDSSGAEIWLDSTPGVAPFGLIPLPLRGKEALLVASDRPDPVVRTPQSSPVSNSETFEVDGTFDEAGNLEAAFKVSLQGDNALLVRAATRGTPQAQWKELIQSLSYISGFAGEVSDVRIDNVETPDAPLQLSYHYSRKSYFAPDDHDRTLGRNTLPFPPIALNSEGVSKLKRGAELRLGGPLKMVQKARLKFAGDPHPIVPIPISLSRDYGSYTSKYELNGNELLAERAYTLTQAALPAARDKDLQSFLSAIGQDHDQQLTAKLSPASVDVAEVNGADAVKLNAAARSRLDANDYSAAAKFAERAVQVDPQSLLAWNNLGLAYLGQGQLQDAEKAFRKQIEINPFDHWAYNNLGRVMENLKRNDDAIAAYRKQIEIVPLDQYAHKNLGMLLFRLQKYGEAVPELEAASRISPEDNAIKFALAQSYKNTGQGEKASAILSKLPVGPLSSFTAGDLYKASVHEDDDPQATVRWAQEGLQRMEQQFRFIENDPTNSSASIISAFWGAMGWAYFRMNQMEDAERYLYAAWTVSQSADLGSRLAQVYEKQNKKTLALQMYAKALSGEGNKEGIFAKFDALVGDQHKATAMAQNAAASLSAERTVTLQRAAAKRASAELLLIFTNSSQPDKVVFRSGAPGLFERYQTAIKNLKFSVVYPDQTPQHIARQALLNCGLAGCAVVLMPVSSRQPFTPPGAVADR